jgi:phage gp36-like protein
MSYAIQQDLIDRFGQTELIQLTDLAGAGTINATEVARALADADGEIDGYLAGRYALPLPAIPKIITGYACDIARYRLYKGVIAETVQKNYDQAIKFLSLVAQGKISLGPDATGNQVAPVAGGPAITQGTRTFTPGNLRDFSDDTPSFP